jgi:hypothetical protein
MDQRQGDDEIDSPTFLSGFGQGGKRIQDAWPHLTPKAYSA